MGNDTVPDSLVIRDTNFPKQSWQNEAEEMEEEWDAQWSFVDWAEDHQYSRTTYQKIYNRHMGIPPEEFQDGLDDKRTVEQLKDTYGSLSNYYEARKAGELDSSQPYIVDLSEPDENEEDTTREQAESSNMVSFEKAMEMVLYSYRMGLADGQEMSSRRL